MNSHETTFRTVVERNASVLEERESEKHMQECSDCRELSDFVQDLAAGVKEIGDEMAGIEEEHPSSPTIVAYAEGALDAKSALHLRAHMLFCDLCAESYYLLKRMRAPTWTEVVIEFFQSAKEFMLKPIELSGLGELIPQPALKGPEDQPTIQVAEHLTDVGEGVDLLFSIEATDISPAPLFSVRIQIDPVEPNLIADFLGFDGERLASVPLAQSTQILHSAFGPGTYTAQVKRDGEPLSESSFTIRSGKQAAS